MIPWQNYNDSVQLDRREEESLPFFRARLGREAMHEKDFEAAGWPFLRLWLGQRLFRRVEVGRWKIRRYV